MLRLLLSCVPNWNNCQRRNVFMEEEFVEDSNAMSYSFVSENHSEPFVMPHFFQLPEDELDLIFKFDPPIVEQIAPIPEIVENPKTNSPVILVAEKGEEKMEKKELISVPEEEEKDLIVVPEAEEKPIKEQILIPNNDDIEEQDLIPVPETDDESLDEDELIMILENNFPLTITTSSNTIRSESRNSQAFSELSEPTEELNLKVELSGDFKKYGYNYEYSAPSASVDELRTVNTLAIGHFSQIIALRRISDDKRFALKAINREGIGAQEAQILSNLSHINIVQLEALLLYKKRYQLVMEQGICSHEKFRESRYFTANSMFTVANSILQGLNYLKEQQIIHLNLKAQHLLVVMTNNLPYLKICDFGMAQKFPFKRGKRGSAHFMAPETIRSYWCSNEYWYKNDVWSFGITLMEMIQGYAPDHELSESEYYAKVRDPTFTAPELQAPPESWQKIYFGEFLPRVLIVDRYKRDNALMLAIALASIQMDYMLENRPYWRAEG